jgi:hypothetical protein
MSGQNGKELANKIRFQVLMTYEFVHHLKPYQKEKGGGGWGENE